MAKEDKSLTSVFFITLGSSNRQRLMRATVMIIVGIIVSCFIVFRSSGSHSLAQKDMSRRTLLVVVFLFKLNSRSDRVMMPRNVGYK